MAGARGPRKGRPGAVAARGGSVSLVIVDEPPPEGGRSHDILGSGRVASMVAAGWILATFGTLRVEEGHKTSQRGGKNHFTDNF